MSKTLVIQPGGYHPFHAGHYALYQSAVKAFPGADVYVAATNDTSERPFPFAIKEKLAQVAGIPQGHFVQVKSPFSAEEITSQYDPNDTILIFIKSQKNSKSGSDPEGPFPAEVDPATGKLPLVTRGARKGLPVSDRLQYLKGNENNLQPMSQHSYLAYLPTVKFGSGIKSGSELRKMWPTLGTEGKTELVMSMYPATQKNERLAATVVKMIDMGMGSAEQVQTTEGRKMSTKKSVGENFSGAFASVATPLGATRRRVKEVIAPVTGAGATKTATTTPAAKPNTAAMSTLAQGAKTAGGTTASNTMVSTALSKLAAGAQGPALSQQEREAVSGIAKGIADADSAEAAKLKSLIKPVAEGAAEDKKPTPADVLDHARRAREYTGQKPVKEVTEPKVGDKYTTSKGGTVTRTARGLKHTQSPEAGKDVKPGNPSKVPLDRYKLHTQPRPMFSGDLSEGAVQQLSVGQLATISDEALDSAYHYGRSSPGNTFGWQANLKSAAFAKKIIDSGVTDIEKISDAIHRGWNVTAQAFVKNPMQFDDSKTMAPEKLQAKLAQREKLMTQQYARLPEDEKEKDRVVARAMLKAITGEQGVAEGKLNFEEGDCPIFAIALHRLSKMPLMALVEYDDQMGGTVLIHAYVKLDDRWRLDASGETDVDWMLQKYPNNGHAEEIEISEKDLLELGYGKSKCPTLQQVLPHAKEVLQNIEEGQQGVAEGGPFSYGKKAPRKGSVADLAAQKRKEQDKKTPLIEPRDQMVGNAKVTKDVKEEWSQKYKNSINCKHPKGFSQKAHCAGKRKHTESTVMEMTCPDCGMCKSHGTLSEIRKGQKDANGYTKCWPGKHAEGTKKGSNGGQVRNCVPNDGVTEDFKMKSDFRKESDAALADFLARGGEIETVPPNRVRVKPGQSLASKHIGSKRETGRIVGKDRRVHGNKPVVNVSEVNDYFKRRKDEEDRIAGVKPPAKNKKDPAKTDYQQRRNQEQQVEEAKQKPSAQERFNNRLKTKHGIDLAAMERQWAERTKKIEAEIEALRKQEQQVSESYYQFDESWKSKLAGAALAGAAAFGGAAHAGGMSLPPAGLTPAQAQEFAATQMAGQQAINQHAAQQAGKIDYRKDGPITKSSLGHKLEYGIPVNAKGDFINPNRLPNIHELPMEEQQAMSDAYKTWLKDYLSRWPDARQQPDGSMQAIKPGLAPMYPK
jgi:hypothetical protein